MLYHIRCLDNFNKKRVGAWRPQNLSENRSTFGEGTTIPEVKSDIPFGRGSDLSAVN
jgi:hypothetical protein